jgi:hypothetical protein
MSQNNNNDNDIFEWALSLCLLSVFISRDVFNWLCCESHRWHCFSSCWPQVGSSYQSQLRYFFLFFTNIFFGKLFYHYRSSYAENNILLFSVHWTHHGYGFASCRFVVVIVANGQHHYFISTSVQFEFVYMYRCYLLPFTSRCKGTVRVWKGDDICVHSAARRF